MQIAFINSQRANSSEGRSIMERKATTTTPDPELSMPLDMGAQAAEQDQGEPKQAGDVSAQRPQRDKDERPSASAGPSARRGTPP
jgi:hypothetical protein